MFSHHFLHSICSFLVCSDYLCWQGFDCFPFCCNISWSDSCIFYSTSLSHLEFSSNADFSNSQIFAWPVIDYLFWIAQYLLDRQNSPKNSKAFVPGRNPDSDLQHRRGAAVLWATQRDLPKEGEEPQRRVGLGGQHWQLHPVRWGDDFVVQLSDNVYDFKVECLCLCLWDKLIW